MKTGDMLIQNLWNKYLKARGLEAIIFWPEYSSDTDALPGFDCWN